jgi:hypothetical protein
MLSWRIIGVAAGHSKATSNPASKSRDPDYALPSVWGRADGGGWERFARRNARAIENRDQQPDTIYSRFGPGQTFDPDNALSLDVVDLSVLVVVVVIGVAAMIVPVIGHGVSDGRAANAAHDRADRTADNSPGDCTADRAGHQTVFVGKGNLR